MDMAQQVYETARLYLPGGVTASARMNRAIGHPFYVSRGDGAYVYDIRGRPFIDMCLSHGASLLGHNHPAIKTAVTRALELGVICSYETEHHIALARRISEMVPCAEMVRFAGSGTETVMHALRLARTATGREKIIKFEGHFHGYSDALYYSAAPPLDQAGPPSDPVPYAESAGMPISDSQNIVVLPFNDPDVLTKAFAHHGHVTATLMMEPINYDSGCILAEPGFVELCRDLCRQYGALLCFDEVLTAFRMAPGGGQEYTGVVPDLCVLGKAFGGGMPISAIAGRHEVMRHLRPEGRSEISGTYLAHLTAVLAADAALNEYARPGFYERLQLLGEHFYGGFQRLIEQSGVPARLQYVGPRFGIYFGVSDKVQNYRQAAMQNSEMLHAFVAGCIRRGVYFHVAAHHGFSAAHTETDLSLALEAIAGALEDIRRLFRIG